MKPGVPSVAALVTATTISVIAGASPTVDRRSTSQVPAQPTPAERLEISVTPWVWICSFTKSDVRTGRRAGQRTVAVLHSTPEQAGAEFSRIAPKLAVYSHFSLFGTPEPTVDELVEQTRRISEGPLVVGEDLMAFVIGDSIAVERAR
jgi:hypothetical protein